MQIAISKTRTECPLSPVKIVKKTIAKASSVIILAVIGYAAVISIVAWGLLGDVSTRTISLFQLGLLILVGLFICWTYFYERWYFQTYFYNLENDYVVIRKGVFTQQEITIPYGRIQDVYVDQDILDRILGLYDVHLSSATVSSGIEAHIDGVEKPAATTLRASLLEKVQLKNR